MWLGRIWVSYATKSDLQNATDVETSKFSKKADLATLKLDIDKLDVGKSGTTLTKCSKIWSC